VRLTTDQPAKALRHQNRVEILARLGKVILAVEKISNWIFALVGEDHEFTGVALVHGGDRRDCGWRSSLG
jgi:hypothetical protein